MLDERGIVGYLDVTQGRHIIIDFERIPSDPQMFYYSYIFLHEHPSKVHCIMYVSIKVATKLMYEF